MFAVTLKAAQTKSLMQPQTNSRFLTLPEEKMAQMATVLLLKAECRTTAAVDIEPKLGSPLQSTCMHTHMHRSVC